MVVTTNGLCSPPVSPTMKNCERSPRSQIPAPAVGQAPGGSSITRTGSMMWLKTKCRSEFPKTSRATAAGQARRKRVVALVS